jgi:hypothetical protein
MWLPLGPVDQMNEAGGEVGGTSPPLDLPTEGGIPAGRQPKERALSLAPFIVRRSFFFTVAFHERLRFSNACS